VWHRANGDSLFAGSWVPKIHAVTIYGSPLPILNGLNLGVPVHLINQDFHLKASIHVHRPKKETLLVVVGS
jgi:hypothetical protein